MIRPSKHNVTCNVYISCNFLLNNVTVTLLTNIYVTCNIVFAEECYELEKICRVQNEHTIILISSNIADIDRAESLELAWILDNCKENWAIVTLTF